MKQSVTKNGAVPGVTLSRFAAKHVDATRRWVNDPEVTHLIGTVFPVSRHEHETWAKRVRTNSDVRFFAIETSDGRHVGNAGVFALDRENDIARLFIYIGEKDLWGSGAGTEATRRVRDWCFRTLRVHRVEATVFAYNRRAAASYRKAGFREEARLRQCHFHGGKFHDMILMSSLASERRPDT